MRLNRTLGHVSATEICVTLREEKTVKAEDAVKGKLYGAGRLIAPVEGRDLDAGNTKLFGMAGACRLPFIILLCSFRRP